MCAHYWIKQRELKIAVNAQQSAPYAENCWTAECRAALARRCLLGERRCVRGGESWGEAARGPRQMRGARWWRKGATRTHHIISVFLTVPIPNRTCATLLAEHRRPAATKTMLRGDRRRRIGSYQIARIKHELRRKPSNAAFSGVAPKVFAKLDQGDGDGCSHLFSSPPNSGRASLVLR